MRVDVKSMTLGALGLRAALYMLLGLVFAYFLLRPQLAFADGAIIEVGSSLVVESSNDGRGFESRHPLTLRGGYAFSQRSIDVFIEHRRFAVGSGGALVGLERGVREWSLWARQELFFDWWLKPSAAVGLGATSETVEMWFDGSQTSATADLEPVFSGAIGLTASIWRELRVSFEGRLSLARSNSPNPMPSATIVAGWQF